MFSMEGGVVSSSSSITWALKETRRNMYLAPNTAQNGYPVLEFWSSSQYLFTCATPVNPPQNSAGFECKINVGSTKYDLDGGIGGAFSSRTGSQNWAIAFYYSGTTTSLRGIYVASPSTSYGLDIMWNQGTDYELSYGNINYNGIYQVYVCTVATAAPTAPPTIPPTSPPTAPPTAPPTIAPTPVPCVPWTGQAVSTAYPITWALKETKRNMYLAPNTAQNGYPVLEFWLAGEYRFYSASPINPQNGAGIEVYVSVGATKYDLDGGIGGAFSSRQGTQNFALAAYYGTGTSLRGIYVPSPSTSYALDIMWNQGTDYELSYGNINYNGVYQLYICNPPAPTAAPSTPPTSPPTAAPTIAPTAAPTAGPPPCVQYTGQAVNSGVPLTWAIKETKRGMYLAPNTAQNGYPVLEFWQSAEYRFYSPTQVSPQNGAGVETYVNVGATKYDLDGGIGGAFSSRQGTQNFALAVFYNSGTGVTSFTGIYVPSPSTSYGLDIMWNQGTDYEMSYGNINYNGVYQFYICN